MNHSASRRRKQFFSELLIADAEGADCFFMNVGFDNRASARAMTRHLIETGRRRIAMVRGPLRQHERGRQRHLGFLDAMGAASPEGNLFVDLPFPNRLADCGAVLADLLARAPDIDAVFCSGNTFAAGCLLEAQRRGWPMPARLALACLGDVELADRLTPRLSTARIPNYRMGALAARMIIERLEGRTVTPRIVDVGFEILCRESIAPALSRPALPRHRGETRGKPRSM